MKVRIVAAFHRFVAAPGSTAVKPLPESKEVFPIGKTVEASAEDAEAWLAAGLAIEVKSGSEPPALTAPASASE